jgi:hypothetical protein
MAQTDPLALVPQAIRPLLVSSGEAREFSDTPGHLTILTGVSEATLLSLNVPSPNLAAAAYFWVPLPSQPDPLSQRLFRALTSVSTMRNLQVYSESLKRMETFIFDAYRVESETKPVRMPDPALPAGAPQAKFVFFQDEEQTGKGFVEETVTPLDAGRFLVHLTNLTPLRYGVVPLVAPGEWQTSVLVVPGTDHVLVIGLTAAKTWNLFGLERSRTASLYNRMKALVTWFGNNLQPK